MKLFTKISGLVAVARLNEEALFAQVHDEIRAGDIRQGLWLKALSRENGDELRAKAGYAKLRVKSIKDEANLAKAIVEEEKEAVERRQQAEFAAEVDEIERFLVINNYHLTQRGSGWEVKEPLGGRVKLNSYEELAEYAAGRGQYL